MSQTYGFTIYDKNVPQLRVQWSLNDPFSVTTQQLVSEPNIKIMPKLWYGTNDFRVVLEFLERRTVPRTRYNIDDVLKQYDLKEYLPLHMCQKDHGVSMTDYIWIKFDGEDICWEDVAVRDSCRLATAVGIFGIGNQAKFWFDSKLIKLNFKYREAEKEYSAYVLGRAFGLNTVEYRKGEYEVGGKTWNGCECNNFLQSEEVSVSLWNLLEWQPFPVPTNMSAVEFFQKTVNAVANVTGLPYDAIANYIMCILVFDFLICNDDRHLNNIEFIKGTAGYRFAPIFDNGQSFLLRDGVRSVKERERLLRQYKSCPFSRDPDKNIIDRETAKRICMQFVQNAGGLEGIKALPINSWHKSLVLYRIKQICGM